MKKSILLIVGVCLFGIWGCSTDEKESIETEIKTNITKSVNSVPIPDIVYNQIVIKFNNQSLSNTQKTAIRDTIQNRYNFIIQNLEVCDCDPNGPELWTIESTLANTSINVENLVSNLDNNSSENGVEADLQFYFNISDDRLSGNQNVRLENKITPTNNADIINIAIVDTGIDYSYFPSPFLYDTRGTNNGLFGVSGWDFVNHDKDILDDHGHGTTVAKIITSELDATNTPYALLAIKAFDKRGRANYFDVVCGVNYISKLTDIHIVNLSFGWYGLAEQSILGNLLDSVKNNALIITSAGNLGVDIEDEENAHFPSGYNLDHMITVGGYELNTPLSTYPTVEEILDEVVINQSNYGINNVDLVAPFDGYEIIFNRQIIHPIGTSFSTAYTTAIAAKLYDRENSVLRFRDAIIQSCFILERIANSINNGYVLTRNHINETP